MAIAILLTHPRVVYIFYKSGKEPNDLIFYADITDKNGNWFWNQVRRKGKWLT